MPASPSPDRLVFHSNLVRVGAFRCHPDHESFHDTGPISDCCFVFPRTAVEIVHEHERPFVANPRVITLYNRGQEYRRNPISRDGDRCDWFGADADLVLDVIRAFDPAAESRPEHPFRFVRAFSDSELYLLQRQVFELARFGGAEPFEIEELVVDLLERVARNLYAPDAPPAGESLNARQREIGHHVETMLSGRWHEPLGLRAIAREVDSSVYHLCRTFRKLTGTSLHQYRHAIRVRSTLEAVRESKRPLSRIGLEAGFASHSHFTTAFQSAFGQTPSRVRRNASSTRRTG